MDADWVKVGSDVGVGAVAGVGDQVIQNWDDKRELDKGEKLALFSQAGTYYNYGVPLVALLATVFGFIKGEWASRMLVAGSTIAGRKATYQMTERPAAPFSKWKKLAKGGGGGRHPPAVGAGLEF